MPILEKDLVLESLEISAGWEAALNFTYQRWLVAKDNLQFLIRAGTEAWLIEACSLLGPFGPKDGLESVRDQCFTAFSEATSYGMQHFGQHPAFQSVFGYMIELFPYFLDFFDGNFDRWSQKGTQMILSAHKALADDIFVAALAARHSANRILLPDDYFDGNSGIEEYFHDVLS